MNTLLSLSPCTYAKLHDEKSNEIRDGRPQQLLVGTAIGNQMSATPIVPINFIEDTKGFLAIGGSLPADLQDQLKPITFSNNKLHFPLDQYSEKRYIQFLRIVYALLCYGTHLNNETLYGLIQLFDQTVSVLIQERFSKVAELRADACKAILGLNQGIEKGYHQLIKNLKACANYSGQDEQAFIANLSSRLESQLQKFLCNIDEVIGAILFRPHYLHDENYVRNLYAAFKKMDKDYEKITPDVVAALQQQLDSVLPYIKNNKKGIIAEIYRCLTEHSAVPTLKSTIIENLYLWSLDNPDVLTPVISSIEENKLKQIIGNNIHGKYTADEYRARFFRPIQQASDQMEIVKPVEIKEGKMEVMEAVADDMEIKRNDTLGKRKIPEGKMEEAEEADRRNLKQIKQAH